MKLCEKSYKLKTHRGISTISGFPRISVLELLDRSLKIKKGRKAIRSGAAPNRKGENLEPL